MIIYLKLIDFIKNRYVKIKNLSYLNILLRSIERISKTIILSHPAII